MFRLVRGLASRTSAWIAALIFALNPNLIYMQATAMTESLYLALFVWAAVYFSDFVRDARHDAAGAAKSLKKCGLMVALAMLVRYDGWFLAAVIATAAFVFLWRLQAAGRPLRRSFSSSDGSRADRGGKGGPPSSPSASEAVLPTASQRVRRSPGGQRG